MQHFSPKVVLFLQPLKKHCPYGCLGVVCDSKQTFLMNKIQSHPLFTQNINYWNSNNNNNLEKSRQMITHLQRTLPPPIHYLMTPSIYLTTPQTRPSVWIKYLSVQKFVKTASMSSSYTVKPLIKITY